MSSFRFTIICVGKLKEQAYKDLEQEFLKRLPHTVKYSLVELPDVPYETIAQQEKAQAVEAAAIQKHIQRGSVVVALSEDGALVSSVELARLLESATSHGEHVVFVIGGSSGLASIIKQQANHLLSFGRITLTHNFARVLLVEQIYRAATILQGSAYHK